MSDEKARPLREHELADTYQVADTASAAVTDFLLTSWPRTIAVHNVESESAYQKLDIDLLWAILDAQDKLRIVPVEVKGDRYDRTGNFFFETVSNADRGTPGCFLYTKAEWLLYYFVRIGRLYCLPMGQVRPWFLANLDDFAEKRTSTNVGRRNYVTIGQLVPIERVMAEVDGVRRFDRSENGWEEFAGEA
ncbi:MAG: hypothetical protein KDE04_19145 [Anaerolineales bacterium]|nr:hypothetical protein [Anaerolineales bacterium]